MLGLGADPAGASCAGAATPLAWAAHGSQYHGLRDRDFVPVAELLAAAGNPVEARFLEEADGPLYAWLGERVV